MRRGALLHESEPVEHRHPRIGEHDVGLVLVVTALRRGKRILDGES